MESSDPSTSRPAAPVTSSHTSRADTTEAVDALMAALAHPHKDAIAHLRRVILGVDASVAEGVKWKAPSFRTSEYFATTHLRTTQGVGVILHLGAKVRALPDGGLAIADPEGLLTWLATDRAMMQFRDLDDLRQQEGAVQQVLRQWIAHV